LRKRRETANRCQYKKERVIMTGKLEELKFELETNIWGKTGRW